MNEKKEKLTIYDISKEAGVSIATVSRVLNGYGNVNEETRRKVLQVMERSGYKPNVFARGLGLDSMKTVGILCADSSDPYLAKAVYYIEEELRKNHYDALLCCTGHNFENKHSSLELLLSKKVDAAIMVGSHFLDSSHNGNTYIKEAAEQIPVMLLNAALDFHNVYSFYCNDFAAIKEATQSLFSKGRKRLLYIYNSKSVSGLKKLDGFKSAFEENGGNLAKSQMLYLDGNREDMDSLVRKIDEVYATGFHFDGVVTSEDYLAVAAVKFAIRRGLKIKEDISVIGYNNSNLALISEPELTSVDNKLEPMCRQLVLTLMGVLSNEDMPQKTEYLASIIERETT